MTAKEMFESLGYIQTACNDILIGYKGVIDNDGNFVYIYFYPIYKEYEVGYGNIYQVETDRVVFVSIKEHEAITKQMEELGWI